MFICFYTPSPPAATHQPTNPPAQQPTHHPTQLNVFHERCNFPLAQTILYLYHLTYFSPAIPILDRSPSAGAANATIVKLGTVYPP